MNASDIAAWWGAVVASLVFAWDIFKWRRSGPRLRLSISPNMKAHGAVGNVDPKATYLSVEVVNLGDKRTELTHVAGWYYDSIFDNVRRKSTKAFLVVNPAFAERFPCFLDPGERWLGGIEQTKELEEMSRSGYLYCGVIHSASKKPVRERVVVRVT